MKARVGFAKRALILGGLLMGTAGLALMPSSANAGNLIGVDVGPLSVGIGTSEPDYVAPAPAPAPSTKYVQPSTNYVEPVPPAETAPAPQASVPTSRPHTTTETTTYYGPGEATTYPGYQPSTVPRGSETTTTYYPQ